MKVFHYAELEDWQDIKRGSYKSKNTPGLRGRIMGNTHPEAWNRRGVFALTEPKPESWTENRVFPNIWEHLRHKVGSLLLQIEIDPDHAHMLERGHMEGFLYRQASLERPDLFQIPPKFGHETRRDAEKSYVDSIITVSEHTRRSSAYCIPEVFIEGVVPLERISISKEQPYLLESVSMFLPYAEYYRGLLRQIPELEHLAEKIPVSKKRRNRLKK